jgi:hypothetical protein
MPAPKRLSEENENAKKITIQDAESEQFRKDLAAFRASLRGE